MRLHKKRFGKILPIKLGVALFFHTALLAVAAESESNFRNDAMRALERRVNNNDPPCVDESNGLTHGKEVPRKELRNPHQVESWLIELGIQLTMPGGMILIGSGGLLWHAFQKGISEPLPENSMDVDPITDSDEVARLCYQAIIGSEFERTHGWHVNLMPSMALKHFPEDWANRNSKKNYGFLEVSVPSPADLLGPKLKRNEPRDRAHAEWTKKVGLLD